MSAVRLPAWLNATDRLSAIVVVPTPPFGAKTVTRRELPVACVSWKVAWTAWIRLIRS